MKVLPESYRRCLSEKDRKSIGQPTIQESKQIGEARSERELQKLISLELYRRGMFFHWSRMDKKTTSSLGTPDFALPINGRYVAIECKVGKGKQSEEQLETEKKIARQGGHYCLVRTFDGFLEILKGYDART